MSSYLVHSNLMMITTYNNRVILDNDWLKCLLRDIIISLRGGQSYNNP